MNKKYYRISAILVLITAFLMMGVMPASARRFTTNFTGTEILVSVPDPGESVVIDGKLHITGMVNIGSAVLDDPRVSGTSRAVINGILDLNDNLSGPMWGNYYLENEDGSWSGTWTGERTSEGFAYIRLEGQGRGGYQGISAWWQLERLSPDPTAPYSVKGYILDPGQ
ncbi:MAG: hypothetical protein ACM3PY_12855 [Omnitrophica WOR_2 bacterium]